MAEANKNRDKRPWIVALSHHPLYCSVDWNGVKDSKKDCRHQPAILRPILEDLFYEAGVDLMLGAHVHNYERDTAIYKNLTIESEKDSKHTHFNPRAPIYIMSGNAGNRYQHNVRASKTPQIWARFLSDDLGYGRLTAFNSTHMFWEQFSSEENKEIDYVWIIKNKTRYQSNEKRK